MPYPATEAMLADLRRRRPFLEGRARIFSTLRDFFTRHNFLEVHTPRLVHAPGMEPHLRAFSTVWHRPRGRPEDGRGRKVPLCLPTSPEFACKKLLAAGFERIYDLGPVFRDEEETPLHEPEFHMLEWYRCPGRWTEIMADVETLVAVVVAAVVEQTCHAERGNASLPENVCLHLNPAWYPLGVPANVASILDVTVPWLRLRVDEAFAQYTGIDLGACYRDTGVAPPANSDNRAAPNADGWSVDELRRQADQAGFGPCASDDDFETLFFRLFLTHIEPHLGSQRPTLLTHYPSCMAALARLCPDDPRYAERFEGYVWGIELCNAFGELTDSTVQRVRLAQFQAERMKLGLKPHPVDALFLDSLDAIPAPAAGVALGVDRLVMLALGADSVRECVAFPHGSSE